MNSTVQTLYKLLRSSILVVTVIPLLVMIMANDNYDSFMEDFWG